MKEIDRCYRVLGLEPGASLEEVNQAYKDLAFIWHPDRIPKDNPRLQQKAQDKLKEINHARDQLRSLQKQSRVASPQNAPSPTYASQTRSQPPSQPPPPRQSTTQRSYSRPSPFPDMTGADFAGADLSEKDLSGRNLTQANFSEANLSDAFMHRTNLTGAILYKANLFRANLFQANLSQANLQEANLIGADLSGADLRGADLRGAIVGSSNRLLVKMTGANLEGAILPDGTVYQPGIE